MARLKHFTRSSVLFSVIPISVSVTIIMNYCTMEAKGIFEGEESQFSHQIRIYSQIYPTDWQRFRNPFQLDVASSLCSVIYLHTSPNTAEPKHAHIMAAYTLSSSIYLSRILKLHIIYRLASQMVMGILSLYQPRKKKRVFLSQHMIVLPAATWSQHLLCLQLLLQNQLPLKTMGHHQN